MKKIWWDKSKFLSSEFGCEESQGVTYFSGVALTQEQYTDSKEISIDDNRRDNNKFVDLIIDKKIFKGVR